MKHLILFFIVSLTVSLSSTVFASQSDYCAGFKEGYKSIKGSYVLVPLCPLAPIPELGSTYYREGIKDGVAQAIADN